MWGNRLVRGFSADHVVAPKGSGIFGGSESWQDEGRCSLGAFSKDDIPKTPNPKSQTQNP